jgi:release factor glutamine methyltransferase
MGDEFHAQSGEFGMDDSGQTHDNDNTISHQIKALLGSAPDAPDVDSETAKIIKAASEGAIVNQKYALDLAEQRAKGIMLPQLLGRATFMGLELMAEPGVCAVREETELLGWAAVDRLRKLNSDGGEKPDTWRVVDLCCGSGNLTCGIACALPNTRLWAIDIDPKCAALTTKNVVRHALSNRVDVVTGDLFAPLLDRGLEGSIDAVVCNPPYIASIRLKRDRAYLLGKEPITAFDGGPFGINIQLRLAKEALKFLKPGGWLLFEFGLGQDQQVKRLIDRTDGYDIVEFVRDRNGHPRVSVNRKTRQNPIPNPLPE